MLYKYLPYSIYKLLWGDRKKFGLITDLDDSDWRKWEKFAIPFYSETQLKGIGNMVSSFGYPIVERVDTSSKIIFEIGPGHIAHLKYLQGKPKKYVISDVREEFLIKARKQLHAAGIDTKIEILSDRFGVPLPFPKESFDIVISFYSLEHLYPLDSYLSEIARVLKHRGQLVGGIPCEGGLAWGLGRFFTTWRYAHKKYGINYDKIICWEHPNFVDSIIAGLDAHFEREYLKLHPFPRLPMDLNLVMSFVYIRR